MRCYLLQKINFIFELSRYEYFRSLSKLFRLKCTMVGEHFGVKQVFDILQRPSLKQKASRHTRNRNN